MFRRALLITLLAVAPLAAVAQTAPPAVVSGPQAYAPFEVMVGKTWRGKSVKTAGVEDIQRWEWAIGGHAIRITHSVNGGAYAGETLIFREKATGDYIYHYFTTGGFHTTGTIKIVGPGSFEYTETVHGTAQPMTLKTSGIIGADGVYRTRTQSEKDGQWVEFGGFDYREDPAAVVVMPKVPS
ncbi:hypothetical protein [Asticcacaulis sp. YBE204]|uniref:hypothetical protein n=1 Tax=Asticcacaulis sp. YBE204 TaxID=1282363 RepID=UPI0003C40A41|nr:hypothetical protein [Asticcacaulis sp. YBE204]ESQ78008.1 hypothetical protein AEYBE204_16050 [Asticcacaulis sp. YBE204]